MEKQNSNILDELTAHLLQMQQQKGKKCNNRKEKRQSQQDLSDSVVALEPKVDNIPVTQATNPLFMPHHHENHFQSTRLPFKMEVPVSTA